MPHFNLRPIKKEIFNEKPSFLSHHLVDTFDKRDYDIGEWLEKRNVDIMRSNVFFNGGIYPKKNLGILNQGRTNHCTTFSAFYAYALALRGSHNRKFKKYFTNKTAQLLANNQFTLVDKLRRTRLRRMVTQAGGYTPRMALYALNHGVRLPDGAELKIEEYYRLYTRKKRNGDIALFTADNNQKLKRCIAYFPCIIIARLLGDREPMFDRNAVWVGNRRMKNGHAQIMIGDNDKQYINRNSWGDKFGDNGHDYLRHEDISTVREMWVIPRTTADGKPNCTFYLPKND